MITDKELDEELKSAKVYLQEVTSRKPRQSVITRAEIQVELLEELVLWRENGRKWLKSLNSGHDSKSGSLSETAMNRKE
jgi:hypothetical protein